MPYKVKVGKTAKSCHRLKRTAKKAAEAHKKSGAKKVRVVKVNSCR